MVREDETPAGMVGVFAFAEIVLAKLFAGRCSAKTPRGGLRVAAQRKGQVGVCAFFRVVPLL